ncbi:hypothetical protein HDU97_003738 [Phlyctochytrium planicorne]|nr:hypothetical protein HDU97_003738 [Phlyctochytrium planicorne]
MSVPVTIFTGFLGAGKTTIILSLIKKLGNSCNVVLLKNEFGEVSVDSQLAAQRNIQVTEIMNGCLCCVLVGQIKNAVLEIKDLNQTEFSLKPPDQHCLVLCRDDFTNVEGPLAWQIKQLADFGILLDAIITVVDCVNFRGYEDKSYTARLQAQYTDLILLSKHEQVSELELEYVIDYINDLNEDTPKLKCDGTNGVSPDLVFGIASNLLSYGPIDADITHSHEVKVLQSNGE